MRQYDPDKPEFVIVKEYQDGQYHIAETNGPRGILVRVDPGYAGKTLTWKPGDRVHWIHNPSANDGYAERIWNVTRDDTVPAAKVRNYFSGVYALP